MKIANANERRITTIDDLRVGDLVFYFKRGWREAKIVRLRPPMSHRGVMLPRRAEIVITERGNNEDVYIENCPNLIPICFVRRGDDTRSLPAGGGSRDTCMAHAAEYWSVAAELRGVTMGA